MGAWEENNARKGKVSVWGEEKYNNFGKDTQGKSH